MHVIRHDDKCIDGRVAKVAGDVDPALLRDTSGLAEPYLPVGDFAE
jgi:hypothetical protein